MSVTVANPTTLDYLRDIIKTEMDIVDKRINIFNQKFDIPNDKFLFVTIGYKYSKIYSSRNITLSGVGSDFTEYQLINTQEHLYIDLFSRGLEALQRKEEAVQALYSVYSQQQQEAGSFRIFRIANIQDLSYLEGSAILYRFQIPVVVFSQYSKTLSPDFYDAFPVSIEDDGGTPLLTSSFTSNTTAYPVAP
jgi:hypothetical protein